MFNRKGSFYYLCKFGLFCLAAVGGSSKKLGQDTNPLTCLETTTCLIEDDFLPDMKEKIKCQNTCQNTEYEVEPILAEGRSAKVFALKPLSGHQFASGKDHVMRCPKTFSLVSIHYPWFIYGNHYNVDDDVDSVLRKIEKKAEVHVIRDHQFAPGTKIWKENKVFDPNDNSFFSGKHCTYMERVNTTIYKPNVHRNLLGKGNAKAKIATIILDYCNTIIALEKEHLYHNDLTPKNLMIGVDGHGVVIDFSMATKQGKKPRNYDEQLTNFKHALLPVLHNSGVAKTDRDAHSFMFHLQRLQRAYDFKFGFKQMMKHPFIKKNAVNNPEELYRD